MKHILSLVLRALTLIGAVAVCIVFYLFTIGFFDLTPAVGLLPSPSGRNVLDLTILQDTLAAEDISLFVAEEGESHDDAAARMLAQGAQVLIVAQDDAQVSDTLLTQAAAAGASILFVGDSPTRELLGSADTLWYLGSLPAYGGELLGKAVALDYREGVLADRNGDLLLQYYLYMDSPAVDQEDLAAHVLSECEHYGVYTAEVSYTDAEGNALPFDAESLAEQSAPEAIFCTSARDARHALATAEALGWLEGEQPVRIYTATQAPAEAAALVEEGIQAVVHADPEAVATAAARMTLNMLDRLFPGIDTGLSADSSGQFILPSTLTE